MAVFLARALAGSDAAVPAGPAEPSFSDVPADHWAYRYIEYAAAQGVTTGFPEGDYRPGLTVDRAQMAVFMARSIASPTGEEGLVSYTPPAVATFSDVPVTHWARKHIEYIVSRSVATGYDDGTYRPADSCTRDQMAVFVARAFGLLP
jgi:hypothetical protein